MGAHGGALKLYTPDKHTESPIKLFYHCRTPGDPEGAPDEWILDKILGHVEVAGRLFFRVKWEGFEDHTLDPAGNFFHKFSGPLIEYGVKNGVHMDVFKELEGRGDPE